MKKKLLVCALALTFALSGCSASQNSSDGSTAAEPADESLTESVEGEVYEEEAETSAPEPSETAKADMDLEISDKNLADGKASDFVTIGDYKNILNMYPEGSTLTNGTVKLPEGTSAEEGMTAAIAYAGTVVGEDSPRDGMKSDSYNLLLGSHTFIEGFEEALIGHKSGETVEFTIPFPENYAEETLAGKDTDWVVPIYSLFYSAEQVFLDFSSEAKIDTFPKDIYDRSLNYITDIYTISAENSGQTLEDFVKTNNINLDMLARSEARNWLVGLAIMEAENITEESEEYTSTMSNIVSVYGYQSLDAAVEAGMPESYINAFTARQVSISKMFPDTSANPSTSDESSVTSDTSQNDVSTTTDSSTAAE